MNISSQFDFQTNPPPTKPTHHNNLSFNFKNIYIISSPTIQRCSSMGGSILILFFFFLLLLKLRNKNTHKESKPGLPPGSMGLPYIGETFNLYSKDPNLFFSSKQERYGEIFKTRLLGCPCVMLASPEACRFVLVLHPELFKPTYPKSKESLIGSSAIFFQEGEGHLLLRKLVQKSLSPSALTQSVDFIESEAIRSLESCSSSGSRIINTFSHVKMFSLEVGIHSALGEMGATTREELKRNYNILDHGYNSFPINLPGTSYNKATMARKRLSKIISGVIEDKKKNYLGDDNDILSHLLRFRNGGGEGLSEKEVVDNVIGVIFAARDTTASAITWALKFLSEDMELLRDVKDEHFKISKLTEKNKGRLTWALTRNNMPLTKKVIKESLRKGSIIPFVFREAIKDVTYNGYLIQKGWKVMPLFRNIHHNQEYFIRPQTFDVSRFEAEQKPHTFMPFGCGIHSCPGNELANLEILIFVHHLVTKFRWEVVGSSYGIECSPFLVPQNGLEAIYWKERDEER